LRGDWARADMSQPRHQVECSGRVAAYVQWHMEHSIRSLRHVEHAAGTAEHAAGTAEHAAGTAEHAAGTVEHTTGTAEHTTAIGGSACRRPSRPRTRTVTAPGLLL